MRAWSYLATRLNGDGTETLLTNDFPLSNAEIYREISGPGGISGTVTPEIANLKVNGKMIFDHWSTAIYAECDGRLRGGGILVGFEEQGSSLALDAMGFSGYPNKQPYIGDTPFIQADPLDIVRHIFAHLQGQPRGNLGIILDSLKSPRRIGEPEQTAEFETSAGEDVSFEHGPFRLADFKTKDLGRVISDLAIDTPFDYIEEHSWNGEEIRHYIRLGYPMLGARKDQLRFVLGENVFEHPAIESGGEEYANDVTVHGAGEGSEMRRGRFVADTHRIRRAIVLEDKSIESHKVANRVATSEAQYRTGEADFSSDLVIKDHPNAPLGSYDVGDEILVQKDEGWTEEMHVWCRVQSMSISPETGFTNVEIVRSEKVAVS